MNTDLFSFKNILITGGAGSFGYQAIIKILKASPSKIIVYSRDEDKHRELKSYFKSDKIKTVLGDIRDYDKLYTSMKGVDMVLHAGALKQIPQIEFNPMEAVKTNTLGAYNVLRASIENGVQDVIGISTDKAVKPVNAYGMSKALQEKIFQSDEFTDEDTTVSCVRYGNVLGSRGSILPVWDKAIKEKQPIPITHSAMRRFFLTLDEAFGLVEYALDNAKGHEIFVKHSPACYIKDFAEVYSEMKTGKKNYPLEYIGIRAGEKLDEILISEEEWRMTDKRDGFYIINRYIENDLTMHEKNLNASEYSSESTTQLNKSDIKRLLKQMEWIK